MKDQKPVNAASWPRWEIARCAFVQAILTWGRSFLKTMRTKGSCRFSAYYKIQFWRVDTLSWQDIQKSFPTPEDAKLFAKGTGYEKTRIMEITTKGRSPLQ